VHLLAGYPQRFELVIDRFPCAPKDRPDGLQRHQEASLRSGVIQQLRDLYEFGKK
jgi:hypothetical protein